MLEQLCTRCSKITDELLEFSGGLGIKRKGIRSQSLKKAVEVLRGNEELKSPEARLAGLSRPMDFACHCGAEGPLLHLAFRFAYKADDAPLVLKLMC